jgi:hypothetical protein
MSILFACFALVAVAFAVCWQIRDHARWCVGFHAQANQDWRRFEAFWRVTIAADCRNDERLTAQVMKYADDCAVEAAKHEAKVLKWRRWL